MQRDPALANCEHVVHGCTPDAAAREWVDRNRDRSPRRPIETRDRVCSAARPDVSRRSAPGSPGDWDTAPYIHRGWVSNSDRHQGVPLHTIHLDLDRRLTACDGGYYTVLLDFRHVGVEA